MQRDQSIKQIAGRFDLQCLTADERNRLSDAYYLEYKELMSGNVLVYKLYLLPSIFVVFYFITLYLDISQLGWRLGLYGVAGMLLGAVWWVWYRPSVVIVQRTAINRALAGSKWWLCNKCDRVLPVTDVQCTECGSLNTLRNG
jgi:hypothetical protein